MLAPPERERQLVVEHELQALAFQGALDGLARHLLPPGARLLVLHEEVLVVDPRQMEPQPAPVDLRSPHQTGVTERSVGGGDREAADLVHDDMVVGELEQGIGHGLAVVLDAQH